MESGLAGHPWNCHPYVLVSFRKEGTQQAMRKETGISTKPVNTGPKIYYACMMCWNNASSEKWPMA